MAEEALEKLEEQLKCSICLDTYIDPKQLQCNHVFCQQCLVPLVKLSRGLTCPTCRQVTPVPGRVADLQSAFHINHLLEIKEALQKIENPATTPEGAVGGATFDGVPSKYFCLKHPDEEVKLYCETCGELSCLKCALKGGKHHDHDYEELDRAFQKYKEVIMSSLQPMEKQVTTRKKALAQLDTRCGEISHQQAATEDEIRITFTRLREVLTVREAELIGQLDQVTRGKLNGLAAQRDQIETSLAQLISIIHFVRESLETGKKEAVLKMKNRAKELTTQFQLDILRPNTEADIMFSAPANPTAACQNYGQVLLASEVPDPSKCHATGEGVRSCSRGEIYRGAYHRDKPRMYQLFCLRGRSRCYRLGCSVQFYMPLALGVNHVRSPSSHWNAKFGPR